jgi:hypothetical protein
MGARHARQVCRHTRRVSADERPQHAGPGSIGSTISRWLSDRLRRCGERRAVHVPSGSSNSTPLLLQARRDEALTYTELADALRRVSVRPSEGVRELWRRVLFNLLTTNVDDHLWNMGVLYAGEGRWPLQAAWELAVRATHFPAGGRTIRQILFVRKKSKAEPQGTPVHDLVALYDQG